LRVKLRQKECKYEKGRCAPLGEGVILRAIGNSKGSIWFHAGRSVNREGYSQMKKSITLSLVLATSLGLAACGEKAADEAATTDAPAAEAVAEEGADAAAAGADAAAAGADAAAAGADAAAAPAAAAPAADAAAAPAADAKAAAAPAEEKK